MTRTLVSTGLAGLMALLWHFQFVGDCCACQAANDADEIQRLALKREDDAKLIDGLRTRRLFDLAELYCQQQLSQPKLDPTSQSHFTIELIKTQTSQAILSPVGERSAAWGQVANTTNEFLKNHPGHPRVLLVRVQQALSHITHGKLLRQELAAEMATGTAREEALNELRIARGQLEDLERDIEKAIPDRRGRSLTEHDLSVEQLLNLKNNLRYQMAICELNRSQLFEAGDRLNRENALAGVKQRLAEVKRSTMSGQPLWWSTTLGELECFRLSGDFQAAKALVDSLPEEVSPGTNVLLVEQKIRLAIAVGNQEFAQQTIREFTAIPAATAQLDLALIELAVDLSARAATDDRKKEWLNFASSAARAMETNHGGYWGRRADLVLIRAAGGKPTAVVGKTPNTDPLKMVPTTGQTNSILNTELDQLIRFGEDAFRKNNLDDAIKAYDSAATKARSLGDPAQALRLDMTIGQILETQSKHQLAAERFINASLKDTKVEFASSAHLRGCWNLTKTFKQTPENIQQFDKQLVEHLSRWANFPSANQARLYWADRLQRKQDWQRAFETYLAIANDSPHLKAGLTGATWTAKKMLQSASLQNKPPEKLTREIVAALKQKRATLQADDPVGMQFDLLSTELNLIYDWTTVTSDLANRLLPMESSSDPNIANPARAIRTAILINRDPDAAKQLLKRISEDQNALELCDRCLEAVSVKQDSTAVLELRLSVIEALTAKNSGDQQTETSWLIKKSELLGALGRHDESSKILAELETKFPRNAGIKMQLARSLTIQFQQSDPAKPLDKWRRLLRQLKSYTPNWYEAKYNVAKLLIESGKKDEAIKILKLLKEIGPGWDDSNLKTDFEALLKLASQRP